jgi:hypothetical protein
MWKAYLRIASVVQAPTGYFNPPKHSARTPSVIHQSYSRECEEPESVTACGSYSHFLAKVKEHGIDDEGFFEASSHADCEPHLVSTNLNSLNPSDSMYYVDRRV